MDGQFLNPLPVDFLGLVNFNVVDQLIQHPGCQLFSTGVFADNGEKHICGNGFACQLLNFRAEGFHALLEFQLFRLVALGHFGKAFI